MLLLSPPGENETPPPGDRPDRPDNPELIVKLSLLILRKDPITPDAPLLLLLLLFIENPPNAPAPDDADAAAMPPKSTPPADRLPNLFFRNVAVCFAWNESSKESNCASLLDDVDNDREGEDSEKEDDEEIAELEEAENAPTAAAEAPENDDDGRSTEPPCPITDEEVAPPSDNNGLLLL